MLLNGAIGLKSECGTWILEAAKGDNWRQVKATNCDKFIAAFCRFLPLGFEPLFFQTISLGDGVYDYLPADAGKTNARSSRRTDVLEAASMTRVIQMVLQQEHQQV